jgi:hypothetical protein
MWHFPSLATIYTDNIDILLYVMAPKGHFENTV